MGNRGLPDLSAERSLIQALLLDPDRIADVADALHGVTWADALCGAVWREMERMDGEQVTPTVPALVEALGERLEPIGGTARLAALIDAPRSVRPVAELAEQVAREDRRRRLRGILTDALEELSTADPMDLAGRLDQRLAQLTADRGRDWRPLGDALAEVLTTLERLSEPGADAPALRTGIGKLDALIVGLRSGELTILAARPGVGKTALALQIALEIAGDGRRVAVASLEMTAEALALRALAARSGIAHDALRRGGVSTSWDRITDAVDELRGLGVEIYDRPRLTPATLYRACRRLQRDGGLDLLVIDYLQLMQTDRPTSGPYERASVLSVATKRLARALDLPILCVAQLSRASEHRGGKERRPRLSDLRDSGQIEQDADAVWLLYRPEMDSPDRTTREVMGGMTELIVAKQRNGPTGMVSLRFDDATVKFT